jgi:hypothetical protein
MIWAEADKLGFHILLSAVEKQVMKMMTTVITPMLIDKTYIQQIIPTAGSN